MNNLWTGWKKGLAASLSLVLVASLLSACSKGSANQKDQERVLRVATTMGAGPNDDWLRQNFTEIYEFTHPNVKIEFIATNDDRFQYKAYDMSKGEKPADPIEKLKEVMDGPTPPDLIISNGSDLKDLIAENRLMPLDPLITKAKFDTSDYVPAVIDGMKKLSPDGKLYALAPLFTSSALLYNKQIFDNVGVTYPQDNMTWDQIFDLAKRVTKDDSENPIYGFSFNRNTFTNVFNDLNTYTAPLNLTIYDDNAENMTVDTDQWVKVWQTMIDLVKANVMPGLPDQNQRMKMAAGDGDNGPFAYDNFLSGRLAMTIVNYSELDQLINVNKSAAAGNIANFQPVQWDVATMPTHPEAPGVGGMIWYNGVMSINAKAQNQDDAWDLIQFVNSKKWMELKAQSAYQLVARKELNKPKEGLDYNIGAFFQLTPSDNPYDSKIYREKPNIWNIQNIGQQKFQAILQGSITVKQALGEWQTEGNVMLKKIKDNPNGPLDINVSEKAQRAN